MRLPKNILFDLDGTLLDSLPGIDASIRDAFTACGREMPPVDVRAEIGPPMRAILRRLVGEIDEAGLDALEQSFRRSYDTEGWKNTPCFPGAQQALHALRDSGHSLFVVSNKPTHIAPKILEREGVLALFEQVYTREARIPHFSGKREMIEVLLATHRSQSAECIMVGDTLEDAEAALAHSMPFILMKHGYGDVPVSGSVPVAARFSDFEEFLPLTAAEAKSDR